MLPNLTLFCLGPVSYTHLDVYKRQIQTINKKNWKNGLPQIIEGVAEMTTWKTTNYTLIPKTQQNARLNSCREKNKSN